MKNKKGFLKGAIAGLVLVMVVSSGMAIAGHTGFVDVDDAKFYAEPVKWAKDNGITTGSPAGSDTFKPDDPVTRGENVTFAKRYDDNVAQPAFAALEAADAALEAADANMYTKAEVDSAIEAAAPEIYHAIVNADGSTRTGTSTGVSVVKGVGSGFYEVTFPPTDIRSCAFQATLAAEPTGLIILFGPTPPDGQISVAEDWDGAIFESPDPDSLEIQTDDSAGTAADRPFHVTVFC